MSPLPEKIILCADGTWLAVGEIDRCRIGVVGPSEGAAAAEFFASVVKRSRMHQRWAISP